MKLEKVTRMFRLMMAGTLLSLVLAGSAAAQDLNNSTAIGVPAFSTTTNGPEQINIGNLNRHWEFPIVSKPGRGLPFHFALAYDSGFRYSSTNPNLGWSIKMTVPTSTILVSSVSSPEFCNGHPATKKFFYYAYIDDTGARHTFNRGMSVSECNGTTFGSGSGLALDGSGYMVNLSVQPYSATVNTPSGATLTFDSSTGRVNSITDSNGNQLLKPVRGSPAADGGQTIVYADTLGMPTVTATSGAAVSGVNPPPYLPDTYTYSDANGNQQTVTVNFSPFNVQTAFACVNQFEFSANPLALVTSIVYPDGSTYAFTYEPTPGVAGAVTGRLQSITLPTGGNISYTYTGPNNGHNCADGSTMGLTRQDPDGTTTYSRTNISGSEWKTVVTYPADSVTGVQNQTDFFFQQFATNAAHSNAAPLYLLSETKRQIFSGPDTGTPLETIHTCYNGATPDCTTVTLSWPFTQITELTQLANGMQKQNVTFKNAAGLTTEVDEYDFGQNAAGPLLQKTVTAYASLGNNILDRPSSVTVYDGAGHQAAQTQYAYDESTPTATNSSVPQHFAVTGSRGNATSTSRWLNTNGSLITSHRTFDDTGNTLTSTDPVGNQTQFSYADNFSDGVNRNSLAYVTRTTLPDTGSPNPTHHVTSAKYDANTGRPASAFDQNGNETDFAYDLMLRPVTITLPADANGNHPKTTASYPDPNTVKVQKTITASLTDTVTGKFDGLGRTAHNLHAVPPSMATTDALYDSMGRLFQVSNPYFSTSELTYGVTKNQYDALARITQTVHQDGSISMVAYAANCTTTTDEAGKQRHACSDGLGRLTSVWEDPGGLNYETDYQYDVLGNLLRVDQKGSAPTDSTQWRTRLFTYDSLSRLLTANNPESGAISHFYDDNGNLTQKVMPSPNQTGTATHTVSYCYDQLNRLTGKAYSWQNCQNGQLPQGTAAVSYKYDETTNSIGHLTSLADQAGTATYTYDVPGRLSSESRTIAGVTKTMSYTYNLDGSVATLTYPSGALITYTPDSAGRLLSAVDSNNQINYVTGATYNAPRSLTGSTYGQTQSFSGIVNTFSFNSRLQPVNLWSSSPTRTLMNLIYDFHAGNGNNGNVYGIINNRDNSRSQTFTYDALNRLLSAQNAGTDCSTTLPDGHTEYWGNSYVYDAWGNLNQKQVTKCSAENLNTAVNPLNRLQSYDYDSAGNMTKDNNGTNYLYDAENRISSTSGFSYIYDADGNRVQKINGNTAPVTGTLYWYMAPGIVAESDLTGNLQSEYVFFDGERVARKDFPGNAVSYYFSDHLKTASVISDATGSNIKSESDYYPWGGELQFANADSNHYKFTGKERDSETGLDYFGARHYSNTLGRFITPDWSARPVPIPYANLFDPQSLNQYSYVRNIPTSNVDLDGHGCPPVCEPPPTTVTTGAAEAEEVAQATEEAAEGAAAGVSFGAAAVGMGVVFVPAMIKPDILPGGTVSSDWPKDENGKYVNFNKQPTPSPSIQPKPQPPPSAQPNQPQTPPAPQASEHTKGKRRSRKDDHERKRPGTSPPPNYKPQRKYVQPKDDKKKDKEKPPYHRKDRDKKQEGS